MTQKPKRKRKSQISCNFGPCSVLGRKRENSYSTVSWFWVILKCDQILRSSCSSSSIQWYRFSLFFYFYIRHKTECTVSQYLPSVQTPPCRTETRTCLGVHASYKRTINGRLLLLYLMFGLRQCTLLFQLAE